MAGSVKNSCGTCNGACCRYVSVNIPTPNSLVDFDEIRWFVSHENVVVYKDCDDDWIVEFNSMCGELKDNMCVSYENRPNVCRGYDSRDCTHLSTDDAKIVFSSPSDVERHVARRWPKRKLKSSKVQKFKG